MTNDQNVRFTWRDNWLVKNILAEVPIIGGFFKTNSLAHALHHAGMSTSMILGASTTMMFMSLTNMQESDSTSTKFTKMAIDMSTGMMAGAVVYNVLFAAGKKIYSSWEEMEQANKSSKLLETTELREEGMTSKLR